jgi:hypothetical protein
LDLKNFLGIFIVLFIIISIIFVLVPLPGPTIKLEDAVEEIGTALSADNNTIFNTKTFQLTSKQVILSSAFTDKGINPCSVFFDATDFGENRLLTKDYEIDKNGDCSASVYNENKTPVRARAVVVCAQNTENLKSKLVDLNFFEVEVPFGNDFNYTKYCVVIMKRA